MADAAKTVLIGGFIGVVVLVLLRRRRGPGGTLTGNFTVKRRRPGAAIREDKGDAHA